MSRIKPHGPVSPHFMNHYYGAAKPAPVSDDTALLRQALAQMERNQYAVADTAPHVDVMDYNATITALRTRLGTQPPADVEARLARHGIPMPGDTTC